jgi:hypothetical protein
MDVTSVPGRRFGLTADTHDDLVDWPAVLTRLRTAWGAVDGVLHCGDISTMTALAGLGEAGPVFATRNNGDPPAAPPGLCDGPRLLEIGGVRVGLMFNLPKDAMTPTGAAAVRRSGRGLHLRRYARAASGAGRRGAVHQSGQPVAGQTTHRGGPHDRRWPRVGADRGRGLGVSPEHGPAW